MLRHYYISGNLDELENVENELEQQGISEKIRLWTALLLMVIPFALIFTQSL